MVYRFCISEHRAVEYAGSWCFERPYIHPSRELTVHDFIFMIDGEWEIGIGKEVYKMRNNDVLLLPAGLHHFGIKPCAPNTTYMYVHIYAHPKDSVYGAEAQDSGGMLFINNFINTAEYPNIKSLFEKIIKTKDDPHVSKAYVTTLLYELSELGLPCHRETLAHLIRRYAVSLAKIPTNEEIAEHFHVSKRTAETVFKKQYNATLHEYILKYKLDEGKRLLIDFPDMKLHTMARTLGFYDEYHFSRMFKRHFGVSPNKFKKTN